jgi:hypothetical protein
VQQVRDSHQRDELTDVAALEQRDDLLAESRGLFLVVFHFTPRSDGLFNLSEPLIRSATIRWLRRRRSHAGRQVA